MRTRIALRRALDAAPNDFKAVVLRFVLWRLAGQGLRLHPFDLPELRSELQSDGMPLGSAELAFLSLARSWNKPNAAATAFDAPKPAGDISAENWTEFPQAARLAFIEAFRRRDPNGARTLIEACFASEPAQFRADLIRSLRISLSRGDAPFLENCLGDRAQQVKDAATLLLERIEGTPAFEQRLERLIEDLSIRNTGLLRRKTIGLKKTAAQQKAPSQSPKEKLQGVSLVKLAARLDLTPEAFIEAIDTDDDVFGNAMIASAIVDGHFHLAIQLAGRLNAIDFGAIDIEKSAVPPDVLAALTERFIELFGSSGLPSSTSVLKLAITWEGPLPAEQALALISGKGFTRLLADLAEAEPAKGRVLGRTLDAIVFLMPEAAVDGFLKKIATLPPASTQFAQKYAEFIQTLELEPNHDQQVSRP